MSDGVEIDGWRGQGGVSRAEDLLPNIDLLLTRSKISKIDIRAIAVSAGPGSFTGIRIGIATALGLGKALSIKIMTIPILDAIALLSPDSEFITTLIPVGRGIYCFRSFRKIETVFLALNDVTACSCEDIETLLIEKKLHSLVVYDKSFNTNNTMAKNVIYPEQSLACYLGIASLDPRIQKDHSPLFVAKPAVG